MQPVTIYILLTVLGRLGMSFMITSYAPYLLEQLHVSAAQIELLNAAFQFVVFICEIPTGMMADGRGRAWSVKMGFMFHACGSLAYACATGFWTALLAESLIGIAASFISGAFTAWIADALIKRGEPERLRSVFANEAIYSALAVLGGSVTGHFLSLLSFRLPWVVGGGVQLTALVISIRCLNGDGEPAERVTEREAFRLAWQSLKELPELRWGSAAAMVMGLVIPFNHFWSPYFATYVSGTFTGLIWIPLYIAVAFSGWIAKRGGLREQGADLVLVFTLFVTGISLALNGVSQSLFGALSFAVIHEVGRGLFRPQLDLFFQRRFGSSYRATAGSVISFIQTCGYGCILLAVAAAIRGLAVSHDMIGHLWIWCGCLLSVCGVILFFFRPHRIVRS